MFRISIFKFRIFFFAFFAALREITNTPNTPITKVSTLNNIDKIFPKLSNFYKNQLCAVDKYKEPYKVLISCIISLRTKDEVTEKSSEKLFSIASTPFEMIKLPPEKISSIIFPAGFYKRKGKQIRDISNILIEKFKGNVPDDIDELLKLKGVGRKTANLVLSAGFNIPAICVDTHVHRISNRIGLVSSNSPESTEMQLTDILDKKYWLTINNLMVLHGKNICTPISPKCSKCVIFSFCAKNNVEKSR